QARPACRGAAHLGSAGARGGRFAGYRSCASDRACRLRVGAQPGVGLDVPASGEFALKSAANAADEGSVVRMDRRDQGWAGMRSDQKAVITLINRSMLLIRELNELRRVNRDLERRLADSQERVHALESRMDAQVGPPPLRAA